MLGVLALLPALVLGQASAPPPAIDADWVTVGTYRISGQDVPAKVPPASVQPLYRATIREFESFKYAFDGAGHLVERYRYGGSWDEIIQGLPVARAAMPADLPDWRVKVFILTRADVLRRDGNLLQIERLTLERPQIQMINESLARFAAMAETFSEGAVKVTFDVTFDNEWQLANPPAQTPQSPVAFGAAWLERYLAARINGGNYEAEDRVNRGPWDTVLVVHPGLVGMPGEGAWVSGNPTFAVPFYAATRLHGRLGLSQAFLEAWYASALTLSEEKGYRARRTTRGSALVLGGPGLSRLEANRAVRWPRAWGLAQSVAPLSELSQLRNRLEPPAGSYARRRAQGFTLTSEGALTLREGADRVELDAEPGEVLMSVDGRPIPVFSATNLDPSYLPFLSSQLREPLEVQQVRDTPSGRSVRLGQSGGSAVTTPLGQMLKSATGPSMPEVAVSPGPLPWGPDAVGVSGEWQSAWSQGAEGQAVLRLSGSGPVRTGVLAIRRVGSSSSVWPSGSHLTIRARATRPEPLRIGFSEALTDGGEVVIPGDGEWHTLHVALPSNGVQSSDSLLVVGPASPTLPRVPVGLGQPMEIELAAPEVVVGPVPDGPSAAVGNPTANAESPRDRARFAAETPENPTPEQIAQVAALLKDRSDLVKLNAAELFTRVKYSAAVPDLIAAANSIEHWLADRALRALAFQDTPEAWAAIKRAVEIGPNDFTREYAAPLLATRKERGTLGSLAVLYATRSWQTRRAGALAVGSLGTREGALAQMVFLNELDPAVRLAVAETADVSHDTVVRRLQWHRVNDPSDAVRLACAIRLSGSAQPEVVAEADQAVTDDSRWVRIAYLDHLARNPRESARAALRQAVTDLLPEVRAAALRAFAKIPGPVTVEEVQNVMQDPDPRVREALEALRAAKGLE